MKTNVHYNSALFTARKCAIYYNKKLSYCWQTRATRLKVGQSHQA